MAEANRLQGGKGQGAPSLLTRSALGLRRGLNSQAIRISLALSVFFLVSGTLVSLELWQRAEDRDAKAQRDLFLVRAGELMSRVKRGLDSPLEVARSTASFFEAADGVTATSFARFVSPSLSRYRMITSLQWAPVVLQADRPAFESVVEGDTAPPRLIVVPDGSGWSPAPAVSMHIPVAFALPVGSQRVGFDLASDPERRGRLEQAGASAVPLASGRTRMLSESDGTWSVSIYQAAYAPPDREAEGARGPVKGMVVATVRLRDLTDQILQAFNLGGMTMAIYDATEDERSLLFSSSQEHLSQVLSTSHVENVIDFGQRRWLVEIAPKPRPPREWYESVDLLAGLATTMLVAFLALGLGVLTYLLREADEARRLGKYTLMGVIGRGGMGVVYRARHALLRRETAVKVLKPEHDDKEALARFEREVNLTSRLTHPNTVAIYDYGRTRSGEFYYVMELIHGLSLEAVVRLHGPQPPSRVLHVMRQVAGSLWEAHLAGLVHRDVKPENIMLSCRGQIADFAKVLDFGLSMDNATSDPRITQGDVVVGTPLYMSPEQLRRQPLDGRADIYSLAAVGYFLLTGTDVFSGGSAFDIGMKHLEEFPESPSQRLGYPVPWPLEQLIMRCLSKDPDERFADTGELLRALETLALADPWSPGEAMDWWEQFHPEIVFAGRPTDTGAAQWRTVSGSPPRVA